MTVVRFIPMLALSLSAFPTHLHAQAVISLRAVAKNGIPITPTTSVSVFPNDVVTAEIFISGWGNPPFDGSTGLLAGYQLTLAGKAGALSSGYCQGIGGNRLILPFGWDAPIEKDECPCDNASYPICDAQFGCVGPNHHPEWMAAIEGDQFGRIDRVFYPHQNLCAVDTSSLDIRFACVRTDSGGQVASKCVGGLSHGLSCTTFANCPGGTCSSAFQHYAGTLYLKVGAAVCGTFTYTFQSDPSATFLMNADPFPINVLPTIQSLTLTLSLVCSNPVGACCTTEATQSHCQITCQEECTGPNQRFGGIGSNCAIINPPCVPIIVDGPDFSWPSHCIIDARIPSLPNQPSERRGFTQWTLTFPNPIGPGEDDPDDFEITQIPPDTPPVPPTISSVIPGAGNTVTINLSRPVSTNRWTCLRHIASNKRTCLGYLPGDANSNRTVGPSDILTIIDNLNGLIHPPLELHQCDIDRSGVCTPADILTEIDLLNGANGFPVQNGRTLEACPSQMP